MTGHRRATTGAAAKPTARAARQERARQRLAQRWAAAHTPQERLALAYDYARAAAARRQPDPERADRLIEDLAQQLVKTGDQLLNWQVRTRPSRRETP